MCIILKYRLLKLKLLKFKLLKLKCKTIIIITKIIEFKLKSCLLYLDWIIYLNKIKVKNLDFNMDSWAIAELILILLNTLIFVFLLIFKVSR